MRIRPHRLFTLLVIASLVPLLPGTATAVSGPEGATPSNPKPEVVPALQTWTGGAGRLTLASGAKVVVSKGDAATLRPVARQLVGDLLEVTGVRAQVSTNGRVREGDILLSVDGAADVGPDTAVAHKEGYSLEVKDFVTIAARTSTGVFWGTRSLLQMAQRQTRASATLARGRSVDWPNYAKRGFMLDVGRRWFGHEFLRDYVRYLSWFKLNTFQVHLNDNEIQAPGGDWSKAQSAFRLASDNPKFAGLAAEDGAFTRQDWDRLEDVAADHFVTVVPEIDAPAHARAFIKFKPELGLDEGNSDHLDLSKPETTEFMKSVFDEFTPWFRSPVVHFGADEYPRALATDYKAYFNDMAGHLRSLGKQPMAWGSFSVMSQGSEGYDKDVLINSWNDGWYGPEDAVEDGYRVTNTNDGQLYIVPFANYYHGKGLDGPWLYDAWEPHISSSQSVPPQDPLLDGAMSAVWNDLVHEDYDGADVHGLVEPTFGLLAQKMWRGVEPGQSYAEFMETVSRLGVGPGTEDLTSTLFTPGDPSLDATLDAPTIVPAGSSATVTLTVRNRGQERVSHTAARLPLSAPGLTVTPKLVGAKRLEPGQVTSWSWAVTASKDAGYSAAAAVVRMDGDRSGVPVFSARQLKLRTVTPAPEGLDHLSYDARATASSVEADLPRLAATQANDGDPSTRWASNYHDAEWLQLELDQPADVSQVEVQWEDACATAYKVQVSADGKDWADAASVQPTECGTDTVDLDTPDPVRFIRVQGVARRTTYGYSIFELRVFGKTA